VVLAAGCGKPHPAKRAAKKAGHGHAHPEHGPHAGALAEWGDGDYHVEFTVDHAGKQATVYLLDRTAQRAPRVAADKVTQMTLTLTNVTPPLTLELKHDPHKSDAKGVAFVATHDQLGKEMEFKGTISGKVGDKDFAGDFTEEPHDHQHSKE
jgi:hypothetical protein